MLTIPKNFDLTGKSRQQLQKLYDDFKAEMTRIEDGFRRNALKLQKDQRYQELKRLCLRITTKLESDGEVNPRARKQSLRRAA